MSIKEGVREAAQTCPAAQPFTLISLSVKFIKREIIKILGIQKVENKEKFLSLPLLYLGWH